MDYSVQCMNTVAMVAVLTMHSSGWLSRTTTLAWCVRDWINVIDCFLGPVSRPASPTTPRCTLCLANAPLNFTRLFHRHWEERKNTLYSWAWAFSSYVVSKSLIVHEHLLHSTVVCTAACMWFYISNFSMGNVNVYNNVCIPIWGLHRHACYVISHYISVISV